MAKVKKWLCFAVLSLDGHGHSASGAVGAEKTGRWLWQQGQISIGRWKKMARPLERASNESRPERGRLRAGPA